MLQRKTLMRIYIFIFLLAVGCGNPGKDTKNGQGDHVSQNMVSGNESGDLTGSNEAGDMVSSNENENGGILQEGEIIELSNGLYAYLTTEVSGDIEIDGVTEWIKIRETNPETGASNDNIASDDLMPGSMIQIPNVYGSITDIRMDDYSEIYVCYQDKDEKNEQITIPMDFYCSEGNVIEAVSWTSTRALVFNVEELTNKTVLPEEVWSETFVSDGEEYRAVYSRISPMYREDYSEAAYLYADYQFEIWQDEEIMYEVKLYQMRVEYEEVYYIEDINGDGIGDFIQINNDTWYAVNCIPYVFVWDKETKTCIHGGPVAPEEKALYNLPNGKLASPIYAIVRYDRENRIFYDVMYIVANDYFQRDIHDRIIVCGAKFIDGEWKTVYELYLGEEGEDYARETKYDEEGNIISEITCTEEEHYDLVKNLYDECELKLYDNFYGNGWEPEEIVVNEQFSYSKYVRNEE